MTSALEEVCGGEVRCDGGDVFGAVGGGTAGGGGGRSGRFKVT